MKGISNLHLALSLGGYYTTATKYVQCAKYSEESGVHSLWLADSQMIHRDVYECLALCANETTNIGLATGVTNPITRDVTVSASAICTLNEISHGRAIFGLGPGDSSVRRIGKSPSTVSAFESYVTTLRKLCAGEPMLFPSGETVAMRWASGRVPIFISATGERMLQLAGRIGDGVIINVGASKESLSDAVAHVRSGEKVREVDSKLVIADLSFISVAEDRQDAIRAARPYVIWYYKNAPRLFKINGVPTENFERELEAVKQRYVEHDHIHTDDWSAALTRSSFITDEMVDKFAIAGTPEDCVRKLKEKEGLGVELFIARHTGDERDWEKFLSSYCEDILPKF